MGCNMLAIVDLWLEVLGECCRYLFGSRKRSCCGQGLRYSIEGCRIQVEDFWKMQGLGFEVAGFEDDRNPETSIERGWATHDLQFKVWGVAVLGSWF